MEDAIYDLSTVKSREGEGEQTALLGILTKGTIILY